MTNLYRLLSIKLNCFFLFGGGVGVATCSLVLLWEG